MNTRILAVTVASAALLGLAACNNADDTTPATDSAMAPAIDPMAPVGDTAGAAPTGNVVEVAQGNPDFTTLVQAVTSADLAGTLGGAGPFTVFAPTNAAFEKIPAATRDTLMSAAGREDLSGILTYHVVPGRLTAADLTSQIEAGGGTASLTTVEGGTLTARASGGTITLTDEAGGTSTVSQADVAATNGIIHAIDTVVMPS